MTNCALRGVVDRQRESSAVRELAAESEAPAITCAISSSRPGNDLNEKWRAEQPQHFLGLAADGPGFVGRRLIRQRLFPCMSSLGVAQGGIDESRRSGVAVHRIELHLGENDELIGFDGRAIEVDSSAGLRRRQVSQPFAIRSVMDFQPHAAVGVRQLIDPILAGRTLRREQRHRFVGDAGRGDVIEDRRQQLRQAAAIARPRRWRRDRPA